MSKNKLLIIFLVFVLIPVAVFIINGYMANDKSSWNWENLNTINSTMNLIALLGCMYVIYFNYKTGYNSKAYYILAVILSLWFVINLFLINTISNFGF